MKRIDVVSLGEILIDFTATGLSEGGQPLYECNAGGAPANVAVAVAKLGGAAAFIGKTGVDYFGEYLKKTLEDIGVGTAGLRLDHTDHTTLAFVTLGPNGERFFSFCRNPGADTRLRSEELDRVLLSDSLFLHVGSLSLTHEPSKTATFEAVRLAKESGALVSYDPNWRASLWSSQDVGIAAMKSLLGDADLVKVSEEELALLSGVSCVFKKDLGLYTDRLLENGARLVLATLGADGVYYRTREKDGFVETWPIKVVDTTGAGDSFTGALLYRLAVRIRTHLSGLSGDTPASVSEAFSSILENSTALEEDLRFSTAAASLCVSGRGAIPALPTLKAVNDFMGGVQ